MLGGACCFRCLQRRRRQTIEVKSAGTFTPSHVRQSLAEIAENGSINHEPFSHVFRSVSWGQNSMNSTKMRVFLLSPTKGLSKIYDITIQRYRKSHKNTSQQNAYFAVYELKMCEISKVPIWNFTQNFEPIHRKMCILQVLKSLTNCNDLRVMSSEIFDGPLREPKCQRQIFNVWHHQCDVFNIWSHWWHRNDDRGRTYCNATIITQGLCTPAPSSPRNMGDFNFRPLLWDLDPKFNKSDNTFMSED